MCVCVCVCQRERERMRVYKRERKSETYFVCERECVCLKGREQVCERDIVLKKDYMHVQYRYTQRERETDRQAE